MADLAYIDHACLDLLTNWDKQHRATGGTLTVDWATLEGKHHERHGKRGNRAAADGVSKR